MRRRVIISAGVVVLCLTAVAVAIGSMQETAFDSPSGRDAFAVQRAEMRDRASAPAATGDADAKAGASGAAALISATGANARQIRTGTVELGARRERVAPVAQRVAAIVESLGGSVISERSTAGDEPSTDLVLGVPPDRFRDAIRQIGTVAKVLSSESSTEDVSGSYADLDGRVTSMRISVQRLQGFLAKATDVNQIASLEAELTRREADLESTQRQLDALDARISTSTLHVTVSTNVAPTPTHDGPPSVRAALADGWHAFATGAGWLAAAVGMSLPFVALLAVAVVAARWWWRRRPVGLSSAS